MGALGYRVRVYRGQWQGGLGFRATVYQDCSWEPFAASLSSSGFRVLQRSRGLEACLVEVLLQA